MKNYKHILFYVITIGSFLIMMYMIVQSGLQLEAGKVTSAMVENDQTYLESFWKSLHHNISHPLAILFLQIITIIIAARTFGFLFNKIGQPTVIGEVVAGIFLGPSLLGMWFPEYTQFLFPKGSLTNLQFFSQVGLVLFMFVIGMELDLKVLKTKAKDAVMISHASIIIPYALGMGLSYFLYAEFAPANINFLSFSLFMGIAMSITAFPVLARIIQERGMTKSKIGTIAITCAAADDVTAWCILAGVIAIVKSGSSVSAMFTIILSIGYVLVMLKLIQPFLKKLGTVYSSRETLSLNIVALIFGVLLISAYVAEIIGIHALFGAFLAGVIMPPAFNFRRIIIEKIEYIALGLLLPLFFAFSGLRTQIGLLNELHLWTVCSIIILMAVVGKFGGSMIAARFVGQSWKDSLAIGALMNTRGLMELVVLNIGYDLGVLTPQIFAMMVLMALVTTFMTGPALDLVNKYFKDAEIENLANAKQKFKILLSFANPHHGKKLFNLATMLGGNSKSNVEITALHITPSADFNKFDAEKFEKDSFKSIQSQADSMGIAIKTVYKASNDVNEKILKTANSGNYDLLVVESGQSVFQEDLSSVFLNKLKNKIPVAIFAGKEFPEVSKITIPIFSKADLFLLSYVKPIIKSGNCKICILDYNEIIFSNPDIKEEISSIGNFSPNSIMIVNRNDFKIRKSPDSDLVITSTEGSKAIGNEEYFLDLSGIPSLLINI